MTQALNPSHPNHVTHDETIPNRVLNGGERNHRSGSRNDDQHQSDDGGRWMEKFPLGWMKKKKRPGDLNGINSNDLMTDDDSKR